MWLLGSRSAFLPLEAEFSVARAISMKAKGLRSQTGTVNLYAIIGTNKS